jgi:hypothetical protein
MSHFFKTPRQIRSLDRWAIFAISCPYFNYNKEAAPETTKTGGKTSLFSWGAKAPIWDAQGIEAVSFFASGKKDTSVKPGPWAVLPYGQVGARMRPKPKI